MILAELPQWVIDTGSAAGVVVAVLGAFALVTRAKPVRGLWRVLISDPISRWAGSVVGDAVSDVSHRLTAHMEEEEKQRTKADEERAEERQKLTDWREAVDGKLDEGNGRMGALETSHGEIKTMLADALDRLTAGNPEVRQP